MPTGYTEQIINNTEFTFEDYIKQCARAMGAFIHMRDEPMNEPLTLPEPDTCYYDKNIKKYQELIESIEVKSNTALQTELDKSHKENIREAKEYNQNVKIKYDKYMEMLANVMSWTPPTTDHQNFKNFMKEQIEESIKFDCLDGDGNLYQKDINLPKPNVTSYKEMMLDTYKQSKEYNKKERAKDLQRIKERREWARNLLDTL